MNNEFDNSKPFENQEAELDIGRIFRLILMQSKLIIFAFILGTSLGIYFYTSSPKIFKINSLLQIYPNQQPGLGANSLDMLFNGSNALDIKNIEILYKSRTNMLEVFKKL